MVNINRVLVYIILIVIVLVANTNYSFSHGLNYEIKPIDEKRERVYLKWSNPEEEKGFVVSYYYFTNARLSYWL